MGKLSFRLAASSILLLIIALGVVFIAPQLSKSVSPPETIGYQTPFMLGDYAMEDDTGNQVTWASLSDRPVYLTAGFTRCPHSCPMTMVIYQKLAKRVGTQADFALLTVDPEHDTTHILGQYLSGINSAFIGLRIGEKREFDLAMADLKQTVVDTGEPLDLMHSNYIYLMHPKLTGLVLYTKPNVADMAHDLEIFDAI